MKWTEKEKILLLRGKYTELRKSGRTYKAMSEQLRRLEKKGLESLYQLRTDVASPWTEEEIESLLGGELDTVRENNRGELSILSMLNFLEKNFEDESESREYPVQLEKKLHNLQEENRELKKRLKEVLSVSTEEDRVVQAVKSAVKGLSFEKTYEPKIPEKDGTPETMVLLLSDLHIGETVDLPGLNKYDFEIYKKRMETLVTNVIKIFDGLDGYEFEKLVIMGLGDYVTGEIHEELRESNDVPIVDSVIQGSLVLSRQIERLVPMFPSIEVIGVAGNHGRLRTKPTYKKFYSNWDYLFLKSTESYLSNYDTVYFEVPKQSYFLKNIAKHNFYGFHGSNVKSYMGIPYYGITRHVTGVRAMYSSLNQTIDYFVMGHFHVPSMIELSSAKVIINGSLIGGTEYSYEKIGVVGKPVQLLLGVHPEYGVTFKFDVQVPDQETFIYF